MPRPKKRPWNADLPPPPWAGGPEHVVTPAPETVTVGHSTTAHFVEENEVKVAIGLGGQMIAVQDSRPAVIRVEGESVDEKPQLPPAPTEKK